MAGGTWSTTDLPVLPGFYMNFKAAALASISTSDRGTVLCPVKAHWGPVNEFTEIASVGEILTKFGADSDTDGSTVYKTLYMALLGAPNKLIAYRVASASAAAAALTLKNSKATPEDTLILTAKYPGTRGNNFKITVQANLLDNTKTDIKLYEGTTLLMTFTATDAANAMAVINASTDNTYIVASSAGSGQPSGSLAAITSVALTGGNSGISDIAASVYTTALDEFEKEKFNILALDAVTDAAIHTTVASWVERMRENGKMIMAVFGGTATADKSSSAVTEATSRSAGFNHEGIVNVGCGVIIDDVEYSSAQVAPYVAGLIAGQKLSESTTYAASPFDDVNRRWTRSEQETAVRNGVFLLINDGKIVKVLRGMNTLITLRQDQNNQFKKIRAIRVMDAINTDLQTTAEDSYIGKINNTAEGRLALIGACKQYMEVLVQGGVIEATGWDVILDPAYYGNSAKITPDPDQVFIKWNARLTDVIEQIFSTFMVQ